jgi:hypothetical protein
LDEFFVDFTSGEYFFLHHLLTINYGPISFDNLLLRNNHEYPSFQYACLTMSRFENDGEWIKCFEEASIMKFGS